MLTHLYCVKKLSKCRNHLHHLGSNVSKYIQEIPAALRDVVCTLQKMRLSVIHLSSLTHSREIQYITFIHYYLLSGGQE